MSELNKLIEKNKDKFEIDKDELAKKEDFVLVSYNMVQPPVNLESSAYARVKKYYQTLQAMLIDSTDKLGSGYKLDSKNSKPSSSGYIVTFLKSDVEQVKDKSMLKKQAKQTYLKELEQQKKEWVAKLTASLVKQAEADAVAQAQSKTKLIQEELEALLSVK